VEWRALEDGRLIRIGIETHIRGYGRGLVLYSRKRVASFKHRRYRLSGYTGMGRASPTNISPSRPLTISQSFQGAMDDPRVLEIGDFSKYPFVLHPWVVITVISLFNLRFYYILVFYIFFAVTNNALMNIHIGRYISSRSGYIKVRVTTDNFSAKRCLYDPLRRL
jgi:hypothetical protein